MQIIIDIPEEEYKCVQITGCIGNKTCISNAIYNGTPIPDNVTNGKEVLIKYCLEHSEEEIYELLKQIFDASMSWTDSRGFIIEWLEKGDKE